MLNNKQIQELVKGVNFKWMDKGIKIEAIGDNKKDYMNHSSAATTHSLLLEILAELKKLNNALGSEGLL